MEPLDSPARQVRAAGGDCTVPPLDVSDAVSVAAAERQMGSIDILINNAGIAGGESALTLDEAGWDRIIDTNLKGMFLMA